MRSSIAPSMRRTPILGRALPRNHPGLVLSDERDASLAAQPLAHVRSANHELLPPAGEV